MSQPVSYEEQKAQGLIRIQRSTYLPANSSDRFEFQDNDRGIINSSVTAAGEMMTHRQLSHIVRSDDTALAQAQASLVYSGAYAFAAALITGGIVLIAWLKYGMDGNGGNYAVLWLLLWGLSVLIALIINRAQGLWHSSTGIAHHEIESRERLAMYAIDRHIELIEKRWRVER